MTVDKILVIVRFKKDGNRLNTPYDTRGKKKCQLESIVVVGVTFLGVGSKDEAFNGHVSSVAL